MLNIILYNIFLLIVFLTAFKIFQKLLVKNKILKSISIEEKIILLLITHAGILGLIIIFFIKCNSWWISLLYIVIVWKALLNDVRKLKENQKLPNA